ncbi:MAG: PAS domain S-box protein [Candidatus Lokiarchaeota archaeon]|nr:PAS domain S-box protein [Candidatus Lokiarchaeota archaeon]
MKTPRKENVYWTSFNNSSLALALFDLKNNFINCNPKCENLLFSNGNKNQFIGISIDDVFKLSQINHIKEEFKKVLASIKKGQIGEPIEFQYFINNEKSLWLRCLASLVVIEDKTFFQTILEDLTEHKENIRYRREFNLLVETIDEGLGMTDKEGLMIYANPQIYKLLEYNKTELLGRPIYDVIYKDAKSITENQIKHRKEGKSNRYEIILQKKDGSKIPVLVSASPIIDSEGNFNGSFAIFKDLTLLKESSEIIQELKDQLSAIVEKGSFAFFTHDLEGNILSINELAMQFTGYSKKELLQMNINDIEVKEIPTINKKEYWKVLPIGNGVIITGLHKKKNGTIFPVEINLVKILSEGQEIIATLVYDKSVQEKVENQIKEESTKLTILNQIIIAGNKAKTLKIYLDLVLNICLKTMDFDGGGIYIVNESNKIAELSYHKNLPYDFIEYTKIRNINEEPYAQVFLRNKAYFSENHEIINSKVNEKWGILSNAIIPLTSSNNILGALNITSKKKNEFTTFDKDVFISIGREIGTAIERILSAEKLKLSEERYRSLFESFSHSILLISMNGILIDCNPAAEQVSGFSKEDFIGKPFLNYPALPKEYQKVVGEDFKKVLKGEPVEPREIKLYNKEEQLKWVIYRVNIVTIGIEQIIQVIIENIDDRKVAEDKLKESEVRYRNLFESSPNAIILVDMDGAIIDFNPAMEYFSNESRDELIGNSIFEFTSLPEEFHEGVQEDFQLLLEGKPVGPREIQFHKGKDQIEWVLYQCNIVKIGDKDVIQAIIQYITDKKIAEQKLRESEEKFRAIAEESMTGTIIIKKGKFAYVNRRLADIMGYDIEEIRKWNPRIFTEKTVHPDDKESVLGKLEERIQNADNYTNHYFFRSLKKNGDIIYWELFSKPMQYEAGIGYFISMMDITEVKKSELLVKESEEKYKLIAENANDLILIVNKNFKFEYFNERAHQKILGYSKEDFPKNLNDPKLIHPEDRKKGSRIVKILEQDQVLTIDLRFKHKNGNFVWLEVKVNSYIDKNGETKILLLSRDVSEHKKLEESLKEINNLKTELIRRTSHELKTPLIAIKGFTDLLLTLHKEKLVPPVLSIVSEIKKGCTRLENLVFDLLESSKLESGQVHLKKSKEDISFLIKYTIEEISYLAGSRNQIIQENLDHNLECNIEKERIHDVILNLLTNAIKNTPPKGTIIITSQQKDYEIIISIEDNGVGITPEEMPRLFTQFGKIERYGQGMDLGIEGTGLGLYLSKKIVELHGGRIWAESEGRNKGAKFSFTIPLD